MKFVNLTPHPLVIYRLDGAGVLATLPSEGNFRLQEEDADISKHWLEVPYEQLDPETGHEFYDGSGNYQLAVPFVRRSLSADSSLPEPQPNTIYVVSLPALMGLVAAGIVRRDIVAPDTGGGEYGAVRDEKGQVLGIQRFITLAPEHPEGAWGPWSLAEWEAAQKSVPGTYPDADPRNYYPPHGSSV